MSLRVHTFSASCNPRTPLTTWWSRPAPATVPLAPPVPPPREHLPAWGPAARTPALRPPGKPWGPHLWALSTNLTSLEKPSLSRSRPLYCRSDSLQTQLQGPSVHPMGPCAPRWLSPHPDLVEEPGAAARGDYYPEARGSPDVLPVFAVWPDCLADCLGDETTKLKGLLTNNPVQSRGGD